MTTQAIDAVMAVDSIVSDQYITAQEVYWFANFAAFMVIVMFLGMVRSSLIWAMYDETIENVME